MYNNMHRNSGLQWHNTYKLVSFCFAIADAETSAQWDMLPWSVMMHKWLQHAVARRPWNYMHTHLTWIGLQQNFNTRSYNIHYYYYYYYYFFKPGTSPGCSKKISKLNLSSTQKLSCNKTPLNRWTTTEMRWKRNWISRSSPDFSDLILILLLIIIIGI